MIDACECLYDSKLQQIRDNDDVFTFKVEFEIDTQICVCVCVCVSDYDERISLSSPSAWSSLTTSSPPTSSLST